MTIPRWYEKQQDELVDAMDRGEISREEFESALRELDADLREAEQDAVEDARDSFWGW